MFAERSALPLTAAASVLGIVLSVMLAHASAVIVADSFAGVIASLLVQA